MLSGVPDDGFGEAPKPGFGVGGLERRDDHCGVAVELPHDG